MESRGTLFDLIQRLDESGGGGPESRLVLYAEGGVDAARDGRAAVCERGAETGLACPLDPSLSELLSVVKARETLEVWSSWRGGRRPSPWERFNAVMFYARYDVHQPAEPDRDGM